MLVLTRRVGERVTIGRNIEVDLVRIRGHQVRLGIAAPPDVGIWRSELLNGSAPGGGDDTANDLRARSNAESLDRVLDRSVDLHNAIFDILAGVTFDASARSEASKGMCSLAFEHAEAIRLLMGAGCATSAISLVRLQFEAVTRAMWLLYAATNEQIQSLIKELNGQSEQGAKNLPTVTPMITEIGKVVGSGASSCIRDVGQLQGSLAESAELIRPLRHSRTEPPRRRGAQQTGHPDSKNLERTAYDVRNDAGNLDRRSCGD